MFYVYILANQKHGAIFTGQCDDLLKRVKEHKIQRFNGRSAGYNIDRLMWFEAHTTRASALEREKEIKTWKQEWRLDLFEDSNPNWDDLSLSLTQADIRNSAVVYEDNSRASLEQRECVVALAQAC